MTTSHFSILLETTKENNQQFLHIRTQFFASLLRPIYKMRSKNSLSDIYTLSFLKKKLKKYLSIHTGNTFAMYERYINFDIILNLIKDGHNF